MIRVLKPKAPPATAYTKPIKHRKVNTRGRMINAKITPADVVEMRRLYLIEGGWTMRELGEKFGISHVSVHDAIRGDTWKSVAFEQEQV